MPIPIIIDCDPGHDDAIALMLAVLSPEVELLGVTTVAGNSTLDHTTDNALRVLEAVGRPDIPVAAGADRPLRRALHIADHIHGSSGMDGPVLPEPLITPIERHAVDALAEWIDASPAPVTIVPTGPLTNIALLLESHPEVAGHIDRVVFMGGSIGFGNITPAAEFNVWVDPEATKRVLDSGLDVTMVGLDVTHRALLSEEDGRVLRAAGGVGPFVADLLDFFRGRYEAVFGRAIAPIHDAAAVIHVIDPTLIETTRVNIEVELDSDLNLGRTVVDLHGVTGRAVNAAVAVDIDGARFAGVLVDRLSGKG